MTLGPESITENMGSENDIDIFNGNLSEDQISNLLSRIKNHLLDILTHVPFDNLNATQDKNHPHQIQKTNSLHARLKQHNETLKILLTSNKEAFCIPNLYYQVFHNLLTSIHFQKSVFHFFEEVQEGLQISVNWLHILQKSNAPEILNTHMKAITHNLVTLNKNFQKCFPSLSLSAKQGPKTLIDIYCDIVEKVKVAPLYPNLESYKKLAAHYQTYLHPFDKFEKFAQHTLEHIESLARITPKRNIPSEHSTAIIDLSQRINLFLFLHSQASKYHDQQIFYHYSDKLCYHLRDIFELLVSHLKNNVLSDNEKNRLSSIAFELSSISTRYYEIYQRIFLELKKNQPSNIIPDTFVKNPSDCFTCFIDIFKNISSILNYFNFEEASNELNMALVIIDDLKTEGLKKRWLKKEDLALIIEGLNNNYIELCLPSFKRIHYSPNQKVDPDEILNNDGSQKIFLNILEQWLKNDVYLTNNGYPINQNALLTFLEPIYITFFNIYSHVDTANITEIDLFLFIRLWQRLNEVFTMLNQWHHSDPRTKWTNCYHEFQKTLEILLEKNISRIFQKPSSPSDKDCKQLAFCQKNALVFYYIRIEMQIKYCELIQDASLSSASFLDAIQDLENQIIFFSEHFQKIIHFHKIFKISELRTAIDGFHKKLSYFKRMLGSLKPLDRLLSELSLSSTHTSKKQNRNTPRHRIHTPPTSPSKGVAHAPSIRPVIVPKSITPTPSRLSEDMLLAEGPWKIVSRKRAKSKLVAPSLEPLPNKLSILEKNREKKSHLKNFEIVSTATSNDSEIAPCPITMSSALSSAFVPNYHFLFRPAMALPFYIVFPQEINIIFETIKNRNKEIYLVGGFLRDIFLGLIPHDADFVTNCSREEIQEYFSGQGFANPHRSDLYHLTPYVDIICCPNKTNLLFSFPLRDFTINSLYHDGLYLYDPLNVFSTFQYNLLILLGNNPEQRFIDDPSLMLRLIRFHHLTGKGISADYQFLIQIHGKRISTLPVGVLKSNIKAMFLRDPEQSYLNFHYLFENNLISYLFTNLPTEKELFTLDSVDEDFRFNLRPLIHYIFNTLHPSSTIEILALILAVRLYHLIMKRSYSTYGEACNDCVNLLKKFIPLVDENESDSYIHLSQKIMIYHTLILFPQNREPKIPHAHRGFMPMYEAHLHSSADVLQAPSSSSDSKPKP